MCILNRKYQLNFTPAIEKAIEDENKDDEEPKEKIVLAGLTWASHFCNNMFTYKLYLLFTA